MIDTINGKEQILQNYNARPLYRMWETELDGINFDNDMFETDRRIVIITYAKFGVLLDKDPDFHKHFDYIICDELHSLIKFQYFSRQPNYHSIAKRGLERAVRNDHTTIASPLSMRRNKGRARQFCWYAYRIHTKMACPLPMAGGQRKRERFARRNTP